MNAELLLSWWNLIFELPFGLGIMYLALYTMSGWTFGEADADADGFDHDVDAHIDVDTDADLDHDTDLSHDVDTDADADSDIDSNASSGFSFLSALNWVGVGRMPLSLVLMVLILCWGTLGFAANQMQAGGNIERATAVSITVAAIGSIIITHFVSSLLGKYLFTSLNIARRRHELLGSLGEALYPIDEKFGMVCGRDDRGELFQVACRTEQGQQPIAKGASVQLVAYTANERMFQVVPADSNKTPRMTLAGKN